MHRRIGRLVARAAAVAVIAAPLAIVGSAPAGAVSPDIVISQVYGGGGNSGAPLTNDYVELFNRSDAPASVDGWSVQYASATGTGTFAANGVVPLPATSLQPGQHLLVQLAGGANGSPLPTPDATGTINMSAASGKVVVVNSTTGLACNGGSTPCDSGQLAQIVDLVGYGGANFFEGSGAAPGLSATTAALRGDGGCLETDINATDLVTGAPAPSNLAAPAVPCEDDPPPPDGCDTPATHEIAAVQGSATSTPIPGTPVRVEGVVTGDFQGSTELGGFYLQDDTPDAAPATSDGLFALAAPGVADVAVGDRVLVSGTAQEDFGLTRLSPVTAVDICGTGTIAEATVDLPRVPPETFEPRESTLVNFAETLTATETFNLGRFGEVTVSSDGRLFTPTDGHGETAADIPLRQLLVDDASNVQNPATVPFTSPEVLRIGDTVDDLTGVLSFGFGVFRLQPTEDVAWDRTNPRPGEPVDVGGDVKIASFNTLNYFTTIDNGSNLARGADSVEEFGRQQAKEVEAITGLGADILGLMEVENNGSTAIQSLVDALNAAEGPGTYAFITEPVLNAPNSLGGTFGTDAIKVALIYRPAVVTPVGAAQSSSDAIFSRPPLIQTFERVGGSKDVTVAVNHFKSKGCDGATGANTDQGDGQSCFNAQRVAQSQALAAALDGLGVPNPLIIGDLNAYTEEDPIDTLEAAGYTGLSELFVAEDDRYSFVFEAQSGELDHAMASPELLGDVTGTTIWHINADEPRILDYNTEFNPPALYTADAFRSSDHDPLLLGLDLADAPAAPTVSVVAGWAAATVNWDAPDDGGDPITGYEVRARRGGAVVATASVGPEVRSYTFGKLANRADYTFEVVAVNGQGTSPAGTATAKTIVPRRYNRLDARAACPTFTVKNTNAFPVSFTWITTRLQHGDGVVPANATTSLPDVTAPPGYTGIGVVAGGQLQDLAVAHC